MSARLFSYLHSGVSQGGVGDAFAAAVAFDGDAEAVAIAEGEGDAETGDGDVAADVLAGDGVVFSLDADETVGSGTLVPVSVADFAGVGEAAAFAFAYVSAAAATESRRALSVESALRIVIESTLRATAATNPIIRMNTCARRLYQPETRSIVALYQSSIFCRAFAASFPAASTRAVNASRTSLKGRGKL